MTDLKYLAAPFIVWAVSQTLKVFYRILIRGEAFSKKHLVWIYVYGDGAPSTHSALLASMLVVIGQTEGVGLLFYAAFTVSLILAYNIFSERKKEEMMEAYFAQSGDSALKKIPKEGVMMDLSGHNVFEIAAGVLVGIALGILISWF